MTNCNRTSLIIPGIIIAITGTIAFTGMARNDKAILKDASGLIKNGTVNGVTKFGNGGQVKEKGTGGKMRVKAFGKGVDPKVRNIAHPPDPNGSKIITKVMGKPKIVKNGKGIRNLKQSVLVRNPDFPMSPAKGTAKSKVDQRGKQWKWKSDVKTKQTFGGATDVFTGVLKGKG